MKSDNGFFMPEGKGLQPSGDGGAMGRGLLRSEKLVLYGLVTYPLLNDRELAEQLDMKMSTLTAIKNRLKENDMFYTVRVPDFAMLGNELMIISVNKVNPLVNPRQKEKVLRSFIISNPGVVFHIMGSEYDLSINIAKNYTAARVYFDELEMLMSKNDIIEPEGSYRVFFSLEMAYILNYFDFSNTLGILFGIDQTPAQVGGKRTGTKMAVTRKSLEMDRMTAKERNVLYGLVKYPDLPDKAVAQRMDVTRQTVNRLKKEFEDIGLLRTMRIPNINRIGEEIIAFSVSRFNPQMTMDKRRKGISLVRTLPQMFQVSSNTEAVNIFLLPNFKTYQDLKDKVISFYKKHEYFSDEPRIILFSIDNMQLTKNHIYADLLAQSLNIAPKG